MEEVVPANNPTQVVDRSVSEAKFSKELGKFRELETFYRGRGVSLVRSAFPEMVFTFSAFNMRPLICLLAVKLDFTNYDIEPPSVSFIDPITEHQLTEQQLPVLLLRRRATQDVTNPDTDLNNAFSVEKLIQSHPPQHIPFLCIAGVREYHNHPFHTNDPWLTYKGKGEGTLGFILDQIVKYGTEPVKGYQPIFQIQVQGISFNPPDLNSIPL